MPKTSASVRNTAESIESLKQKIDPARMPRHIAIITDGNGRWAQQRGMPRLEGHRQGYKTVKRIVRQADELGLAVLSLYAFSAENWSRPKNEVDALMHLFELGARSELAELKQNNVRIRFAGRREGLPESLLREMDRNEQETRANTGLILNLAINYGGRAEITDAVKKIARQAQAGRLNPDDITEADIARELYTADLPDPDLLIRTAGELRVSNFLLWQVAYTELWVTRDMWPDFTVEHLVSAIESYQNRVRKFGGLVDE
jgi:undecaprenyl diphosphate synthase